MAINVADLFISLQASQDALISGLGAARNTVAAAAEVMSGLVRGGFERAFGVIDGLFARIPAGLGTPLAMISRLAGTAVSAVLTTATRAASSVASAVVPVIGGVFEALTTTAVGLAKATVVSAGAVFSALYSVAAGAITGIMAYVRGVNKAQRDAAEGVLNLIRGITTGAVNTAIQGAQQLGSAFTGVFTAVYDMVAHFVGGVTGAFKTVAGAALGVAGILLSTATSLLQTAYGVASSLFSGLMGVVMSAVRGAADFLQAALGVAAGAAEKAIGLLARTVGAVLSPALSALSSDLTDWGKWAERAMQAQGVMARMGAMLRASGEAAGWSAAQLDQMAKNLFALGGHSLDQIREAQLVLLRFGDVRGTQFSGALVGARQLAAVLGQDLPSAAQMLGRALESPEHAARMLRRAGLALSPVEEKLLKAAEASGDLGKAQDILLAKVASLGDVAGAQADTLAGRVNNLKQTWDSVGYAVGQAILPWASIVVDFLQPAVEGFAEVLRGTLGGAAEAGKSLLAQVQGWVKDNRETVVGWGRQVAAIVLEVVGRVQAGLEWLGARAAAVFGAMTAAGGGGAAGLTNAFDVALAGVRTGLDNIPLIWDIGMTALKLGWADAMQFLQTAWDNFYGWLLARLGVLAAQAKVKAIEMLPDDFRETPLGQAMEKEAKERLAAAQFEEEQERARADARRRQPGALHPEAQREIDALRKALAGLKGDLGKKLGVNVDTAAAERQITFLGTLWAKAKGLISGVEMTPTPAPPDREILVKYEFAGAVDYAKELQKAITGTGQQEEKNDRKKGNELLDKGNRIAEQVNANVKAVGDRVGNLAGNIAGAFGFGP